MRDVSGALDARGREREKRRRARHGPFRPGLSSSGGFSLARFDLLSAFPRLLSVSSRHATPNPVHVTWLSRPETFPTGTHPQNLVPDSRAFTLSIVQWTLYIFIVLVQYTHPSPRRATLSLARKVHSVLQVKDVIYQAALLTCQGVLRMESLTKVSHQFELTRRGALHLR